MTLTDIFLLVLDMSAKSLAVAIAISFFTLPFSLIRRIPTRVSYILLFIVIFRMICPFALSSSFSVLNLDFLTDYANRATPTAAFTSDSAIVGEHSVAVEGSKEFNEAIDAGLLPVKDTDLNFDYINYVRDENGSIKPALTAYEVYSDLAAKIWFAGVLLFLGYGAVTYFLLKNKVSTATIVEGNIFETDRISVPFILGFIHPKIYLPLGLSEQEKTYVLCHEKTHLRYGDNIVKMVAYIAMSIHWFNLLLWLWFYKPFMIMMEQSCDESILYSLGEEHKADYSETLLAISSGRHFVGAIPVAFGEGNIKNRVQETLKYKKPFLFLTILAVILSLGVVAVCGTNTFVYNESVIEHTDGSLSNGIEVFNFVPGKDVRSASFSVEVWTEEGLYYSEKLASGNLKHMGFLNENAITINHQTDDTESGKFLSLTLNINDSTIKQATVPIPENKQSQAMGIGTTHIRSAESKAYHAETNSSTAICAIVFTPGKWQTSTGDCMAISTTGKVTVDNSCVVVLVRLETSSKYELPRFYDILSLIPWLKNSSNCTISSNAITSDVPADILINCISSLETSEYLEFGSSNIDIDSEASLIFSFGNESADFYLSDGAIYISVKANNTPVHLYRISPNQEQYGRLLIEIYETLGIDYSAQKVYKLPDAAQKTGFFNGNEITLFADFPENNVSLYGIECKDYPYIMLRNGSMLYKDYTYNFQISKIFDAVYYDFDNDGDREIAFIASTLPNREFENTNYFFIADTTNDGLVINNTFDYFSQIYGLVNLGTYVDNENLYSIDYDGSDLNGGYPYPSSSITIDITDYLQKAGKASFESYEIRMPTSADFWFENNKMLFSSNICLSFDNSQTTVVCGTVNGEIIYNNDTLRVGQITLNKVN